MFSLSTLGILIGAALLYMSGKHTVDEPRWELAVNTVRAERLDRPNPGIRTKDTECSRYGCEYYNYTEGKCKKPWNEYCGYN